MKKAVLTKEQAQLVFSVLDQGEPQKGVSISDVRKIMPIMDKLEAQVTKETTPQGERMFFRDNTELPLKESEYQLVIGKLENSAGWVSVTAGRKAIALLEYLQELPNVEEKA